MEPLCIPNSVPWDWNTRYPRHQIPGVLQHRVGAVRSTEQGKDQRNLSEVQSQTRDSVQPGGKGAEMDCLFHTHKLKCS